MVLHIIDYQYKGKSEKEHFYLLQMPFLFNWIIILNNNNE